MKQKKIATRREVDQRVSKNGKVDVMDIIDATIAASRSSKTWGDPLQSPTERVKKIKRELRQTANRSPAE